MSVRETLLKRFKITKTGKVLRVTGGQNHFRAKKSRKVLRQKKKLVPLSKPEAKLVKKLLQNRP